MNIYAMNERNRLFLISLKNKQTNAKTPPWKQSLFLCRSLWFVHFLIKYNILSFITIIDGNAGFFHLCMYNCIIYIEIILYDSGSALMLIFGGLDWLIWGFLVKNHWTAVRICTETIYSKSSISWPWVSVWQNSEKTFPVGDCSWGGGGASSSL